jgi:hypothetical protein
MSSVSGGAISLWDALMSAPDHRRDEGRRYPLASLLLIAVAVLLPGRRDQLGIVRWGRRLTREALEAVGISRNRVPAPSVWCKLFQGLDIAALERALDNWVRGEQSAGHVAIDGKRLRGSATPGPNRQSRGASAGSIQRVSARRYRSVAGGTRRQRDHCGAGTAEDAAARKRHHHRRRDIHPARDLPRHHRGRWRLLLYRQSQSTGIASRHCVGLRAGFPLQRNGRRRLTSG